MTVDKTPPTTTFLPNCRCNIKPIFRFHLKIEKVREKCHPVTWIPWNLSFRYIHCTGQLTPKMKANAEPRLLSSLVWIDSGVVVSQHRLESCNGMTSFMEFMNCGHLEKGGERKQPQLRKCFNYSAAVWIMPRRWREIIIHDDIPLQFPPTIQI